MDETRKYNPIKSKAQNDMRPGFLGGSGGGEAPSGSKAEAREAANTAAAGDLRDAEDAAGKGLNNNGASLDSARENESRAGGLYNNGSMASRAGRAASAAKDIKRGNFRGAFKKVGPGVLCLLVIFIVGGAAMGMQFFMPFALVAQFQNSFNSMHTSAYNRSARILAYQMNNGTRKTPLKTTVFGTQKFSLSKKQIEKYNEQGLKYNEDYEGTKIRVLEYETSGGQKRVVAASKADADKLRGMGHTNAISFESVLSDSTFQQKFAAASQTWRGQFANWFGTRTGDFLSKNSLTRNMFKDWEKTKAEVAADPGRTTMQAVKDTIKNRIKEDIGFGVSRVSQDGVDDQNNPKYSSKTDKYKARNAKLESLKAKFSTGANLPCAIADFVGAVSLMAAGNEALQILNLTTAFMEAVDKTKSGHGDEAPINEMASALNEQTRTGHVQIVLEEDGHEVKDPDTGEPITIYANYTEDEGQLKSAMQSAGIAALFGNGLTDPNDPSVQSFNLTSSLDRIMGGIGVSVAAFTACTAARVIAAVASIGLTVAGCFFPPIVGCFSGGIRKALGSFAIAASVSVGIVGIMSVIEPWLEAQLERDLISAMTGEDFGNALTSGANMYQGYVHRANGGSLSTKIVYEEFAVARHQMIAEEAKIERESLSPFDITSTNTFMGSLMTQLMSFNTANSLMGTMASANSVMNSSLVGLMPTSVATATEIVESLPTEEQYAQTCPYLASIGAVGDSFCNPYMVTDMETIEADPGDVILAVGSANLDNIDGDGNVEIKDDSTLAKYIHHCGERTSTFGVVDQGYVSEFKTGTGNAVADAVIGATVVGDVIDIFDGDRLINNLGYINGGTCVARDSSNDFDPASIDPRFRKEDPSWDEARWYQRFIEDQSLAESMGIIEKSAVTAYLEKYYEQNPLDESYEGVLARWSGLDKETVSDTLDTLAYYYYISDYDPSERYAFTAPVVETEEAGLVLDDEMVLDGASVALEGVVYSDVRNRTYAV